MLTNDRSPSRVYEGMEEILLQGLARSTGRDVQAWVGELFDRHQARLHRLALRMSHDTEDARDLVQETFLRAARHARSIPAAEPGCEAWLVRVLVNLCRDRRRRMRTRPAGHPEASAQAAHDPEPALLAASAVQAALAGLPARRRAIVILHELEDRSVQDVARLLRISAVTVRWHLSLARRELREKLLNNRKEGSR
jgi:RNA polymerase sigma-70 factor (ECF subfamily)